MPQDPIPDSSSATEDREFPKLSKLAQLLGEWEAMYRAGDITATNRDAYIRLESLLLRSMSDERLEFSWTITKGGILALEDVVRTAHERMVTGLEAIDTALSVLRSENEKQEKAIADAIYRSAKAISNNIEAGRIA